MSRNITFVLNLQCLRRREVHLTASLNIFSVALLTGVQSAGCLDIRFNVGTSCERTAPLAEKNPPVRRETKDYQFPKNIFAPLRY
jgi:hypothetical protein